ICLDFLFASREDKEKSIRFMSSKNESDKEVIVASVRHSSGQNYSAQDNTGGHYLCDVLTNQGFYILDTLNLDKTLRSNLGDSGLMEAISFVGEDGEKEMIKVENESHLVLVESFYRSCQP